MKLSTKIWLLVGGLLVLLGGLAFAVSMAANQWDFSKLDPARYENRTVEISEDFQNISIRSDTEDIVFAPSGDGRCRVVFYEQEKRTHTAEVVGGTLVIGQADAGKWYESFSFFGFGSPKITVYLPGAEYAALSIEESTGDIEIPKDFSFARIDISVRTGDVTCAASAKGAIRIGTDTGAIRVEDLSAGELELSVSTGRVEARSVACAGPLGLTVSTGKARLTEVSCGSFRSVGSTGDLTLTEVIAAGAMTVERSTGDVRLEQCDAEELDIRTDTGDVKGSLLTEKVFIVRSDTGRIKVPESITGGKCRVTTDTGDIEITVAN